MKTELFKLLLLVSVATAQTVLQERITEDIINNSEHRKCAMEQGESITMIKCKSRYQLFKTQELAFSSINTL